MAASSFYKGSFMSIKKLTTLYCLSKAMPEINLQLSVNNYQLTLKYFWSKEHRTIEEANFSIFFLYSDRPASVVMYPTDHHMQTNNRSE
jgi:hypothetical protein